MKKSNFLTYCAAAAISAAMTPVANATDQTPDDPAGTKYNPIPTVEEELVYMRDVIALQTLRLDEAEQNLSRQAELINAQSQQIAELQRLVASSQQMLASLGAQQSVIMAGGYRVKNGDTLSGIAREHNTTVAALASANNLRSPYRLNIGQTLNVPGSASSMGQFAQAPAQPSKIQSQQGEADQTQGPQRVAAAQGAVSAAERPDVTQRVGDAQRDRDERRDQPSGATPEAVGVRPEEEEERPYLAVFSDVGGILTPKGTFYVEPSVDFTVSSDNRFFFQGVEIADAILIGQIEATDSDRRAYTESLAFRYGLTNRLEIDGRISYVSRDDRISGVSIDDGTTVLRNLGGSGLGDADMGLHYQLNNGEKFPYAIVNLRAKGPLGEGPFEVNRDAAGLETELATGSGFWTVEPSLTMILPTAPAVIFANVGYQANLSTTPNAAIGPSTVIREFNPGNAIRTSLGVGLSVNDRMSLNFGYDQSHFFKTTSLVQTTDNVGNVTTALTTQPAITLGSFLFGGSYAVTDNFRLNLNTAFGATDESPDMRVSLRAQYKLFD